MREDLLAQRPCLTSQHITHRNLVGELRAECDDRVQLARHLACHVDNECGIDVCFLVCQRIENLRGTVVTADTGHEAGVPPELACCAMVRVACIRPVEYDGPWLQLTNDRGHGVTRFDRVYESRIR